MGQRGRTQHYEYRPRSSRTILQLSSMMIQDSKWCSALKIGRGVQDGIRTPSIRFLCCWEPISASGPLIFSKTREMLYHLTPVDLSGRRQTSEPWVRQKASIQPLSLDREAFIHTQVYLVQRMPESVRLIRFHRAELASQCHTRSVSE